jgi:hypothetical protein
MMDSVRRALVTSVGLMLLRRKLQRRGGAPAAVALLGLELFGPRILRIRRLLVWAVALTIVGGIAAAAVWWWRRKGPSPIPAEGSPAAQPEPPAPPSAPPAAAPAAEAV